VEYQSERRRRENYQRQSGIDGPVKHNTHGKERKGRGRRRNDTAKEECSGSSNGKSTFINGAIDDTVNQVTLKSASRRSHATASSLPNSLSFVMQL